MVLDVFWGFVYVCIVCLFDVFIEKWFGNWEILGNKYEMFNCLKELNEVSVKISNEISFKRLIEEVIIILVIMVISDD